MPKRDLEIRIIGGCASGKTRIACILKKILENLDFDVDHKLDSDYVSKMDRDRHIDPTLPEALFTLKDKTRIIIREEQAPMHINSNRRNNVNFF
jgi:hypothetical protein